MGTAVLIAGMNFLVLSRMGLVIAAVTRPTTISSAPPIPASFSVKPCGVRIWLSRELKLLKKPT